MVCELAVWIDSALALTRRQSPLYLPRLLYFPKASGRYDVPLPIGGLPLSAAAGTPPLLYCGGVYVPLYLKDPGFPLRDPKRFAEGLMERYIGGTISGTDPADTSVTLSAAGVELFRTHPSLRCVPLKYELYRCIQHPARFGDCVERADTVCVKTNVA